MLFSTIPLAPQDKEKFAFSVPNINQKAPMKQYQWKMLPQGMMNLQVFKMAKQKDMCPSSPVRTPELQLAAEQLSTGECWISPKQDTPHPRAKKKSQQDSWVQFSSVAQSCPIPCDPMNCTPSGLTVHHQLPEFTQIHVHWVVDAIQPSHPLSSPSPPAPNPSQHQSLFQWVNSSHEVAKGLEFQL